MKTGTILLLAGGALLALKVFNFGVAGNTLQIVFSGVTPNSALNYTLQFTVQNVTGTAITLNSIAGTVYLNGTNVGTVSSFTPQIIAGNAQSIINLTLDLSVFGGVSSIMNLVQTSNAQLNFEVKGNMNVGPILPFDVTQSITLP